LPDRARFIWRNSSGWLFPIKFGLFLFLSVINLYRKEKI